MSPSRKLALAVALALALPASASAGQPFVLDPGGMKPHVAVAEDGTGHFVWTVETGGATTDGDEVRYCRVPRGATACAKTHRFEGIHGGPYATGPRVLLHRDGRVIIIGEQSGLDQVAIVSNDGGDTFAAPREIGNQRPADIPASFRAELGPGEDTVSMLIGELFQAAPLNGAPSDTYADLGPSGLTGGLALIDDLLTPIVALGPAETHTTDTITFRHYDRTGSPNTAANWTPPKPVGLGKDPDLAGGVSGVYLSYKTGAGQLIRRYEQFGDSFGREQVISGEGGGETISGDLHQSASGSLHQTWTRPGEAPLQHRRSLDGGASWLPIETIAVDPSSGFHGQHVATSGDGGGFAVWSDAPGERVRAVAIVTNGEVPGPEPQPCRVQVGIAVAIAREGCFERSGSIYRAPGDVRLNGIDLSGAGKVTIDVEARSLKTSGPVTAQVGNITLGSARLDWRIPKGKGAIKDSAGNDVTFDAARANAEVLALLVSGWTTPRIVEGEAVELPVNLELPAPLSTLLSDKATGSVTLRASNARSLELANATIDVKDVSIGIAEIERFNLVYQNLDPWILRGSTAILLPVARTKISVDEFGLKGGDFDFARGNLQFDPPGRPLATLVYLKQIRFDTNNHDGCKTPAKIAGGVTLTLISEQISRIEGDAFYKFPLASCNQPGFFRIDGKGFLRDLQVADMYGQYVTPGSVTFGGGANVTTSGISAGFRVDGAIDVPTETFFVEGKVSAGEISDPGAADDPNTPANEARPPERREIVGAGIIVSSIGLRACTEVAGGKFNSGFGFHQRWGEDSTPVPDWPFFEGCEGEAGDFKPAGFKSDAPRPPARVSQAASGFSVGSGVPFVNLRVEGPGGPQVVVRGPSGRSVTTRAGAPELTAGHAFAVRPDENRTYVRIFKPKQGRWTVTPQPGSTIHEVLRADGLPKPEVRVRVSRARSGRHVLSWRLRRLPGQRVRLFERGAGDGMHALRTVSKRRGKLRFRPALGLGGRRQIVALVESRGFPRESLTVARFTAPRDGLPSRPQRVTLKRAKGKRLAIRWSRTRGAKRYAVNLRLHDGRRVTHVTRNRRLVAGDIPAIDGGTVRVAGLRADNLTGPTRKATLNPKPKLELTAKARQRLRRLAVVVGCGGQACRVHASGTVKVNAEARRFKLRPASAKISAGERTKLRLKLTRSAGPSLTKLLKRGRRARATVAVGPAAAGGKAVERVRVRLKP